MCVSLLGDKDPGFRSNAARTLGRLGDASVIPALEAVAGDASNPASAAAKQSIETLKKSMKN
jgi:HEAT repeat protein